MAEHATVPATNPLSAELAAARADALRWDFDLPGDAAYDRADRLLARIARSGLIEPAAVNVAVGENGDIEINVTSGNEFLTVAIAAAGGLTQMLVQNAADGSVAVPSAVVNDDEVMSELERAAQH